MSREASDSSVAKAAPKKQRVAKVLYGVSRGYSHSEEGSLFAKAAPKKRGEAKALYIDN